MAGKAWLEAFTEDSPWMDIKRYKENETFRFGNGPAYISSMGYIIPVTIGKLKTELKISVVEANVPLLLGLDFQQEFGVVIDTGRQTLFIKASGEEFNMSRQGNHWRLPLRSNRTMCTQAEKHVLLVNMDEMDNRNLWKHIKKVHKNLCHKSEAQMMKLFQLAGILNKRTSETIRNVLQNCQICRQGLASDD